MPESLNGLLDRDAVVDLVVAIEVGSRSDQREALDLLARSDATLTEWIAQARCSRAAKPPIAA